MRRWCARRGSNSRPPGCHPGALPAELRARGRAFAARQSKKPIKRNRNEESSLLAVKSNSRPPGCHPGALPAELRARGRAFAARQSKKPIKRNRNEESSLLAVKSHFSRCSQWLFFGGESRIRTCGPLARPAAFQAGAFDHSAISPCRWWTLGSSLACAREIFGGESRIRTCGPLARPAAFQAGAFDHSAISPCRWWTLGSSLACARETFECIHGLNRLTSLACSMVDPRGLEPRTP